MKEQTNGTIIAGTIITAIVHNKRTSLAGLVACFGLIAARLGFEVEPDTLVAIAGLALVVLGAVGGDNHAAKPKRVKRAKGAVVKTLLVMALCTGALSTVACGGDDLRAGASAVAQGAREFRKEVEFSLRTGEITAEEADALYPVIDRVEKSAQSTSERLAGFEALDASGKRLLLSGFIDEGTEIAADFDALHIKNEKARKRIVRAVGHVRRANAAFRIVLAATESR